ncbi:hypothetical protein [Desulfosporosinus nitroreducens]|nr:hypothetical protein [Desulfosporosinus nitroreducens]
MHTALRLFARDGYEAVSVSAIGRSKNEVALCGRAWVRVPGSNQEPVIV